MTIRDFCKQLDLPVPEGPFADYEIFINGLPSFDEVETDHGAQVVYLRG